MTIVRRPETKVEALALYQLMVRIRQFEKTAEELFMQGEIPGFLHLSIGQEAVAAGVCHSLRRDDYLTSTHRGHGHTLAKGASARSMMAELFGRESGLCRGRGGSMHIADFSVGMLGANAIVAGGLGLTVGAALSIKLAGRDQVSVSIFGDGATARGPFHEALNLAKVWNLPAIFICENNGWASTARSHELLAVSNVADRAAAYAMPGIAVDGNDVFAVREATRQAVEYARAGRGPTLLEMRSYRIRGHYVGDPMKYRSASDDDAWAARDPIAMARTALMDQGLLDDELDQSIHHEAESEIADSVEFARSEPTPDTDELSAYLYADAV
jgi:acetoin:2,6-dichlorophenolindophenol oxidoreductase subunit alpha